jgi:hypothetical protein
MDLESKALNEVLFVIRVFADSRMSNEDLCIGPIILRMVTVVCWIQTPKSTACAKCFHFARLSLLPGCSLAVLIVIRGLSQFLPAAKGFPRSSRLSQFQQIMKVPPLPSQAKGGLSSPMECLCRHSSQSARSSSACLKMWAVSLSARSWLISLALNDSFNCSVILNYSHISLIMEFGSLCLTGKIVNHRTFIDCNNSKYNFSLEHETNKWASFMACFICFRKDKHLMTLC